MLRIFQQHTGWLAGEGTYLFRQGVGEFGATAAIGVVMVILLLVLSWGYVRTTLKEEEL